MHAWYSNFIVYIENILRLSISSTTVLSAAHCFLEDEGTTEAWPKPNQQQSRDDEIDPSLYRVVFGITSLKEEGIQSGVKEIIEHPDFEGSMLAHKTDFAILKLERSISFSEKINPACLPDPNEKYEEIEALVSGWGVKENSTKASTTLQMVQKFKVALHKFTNILS